MIGLEPDSLEAYCFDGAVGAFGRALDHALEASTEKSKNSRQAQQAQLKTLYKWLPGSGGPKFRDPVAR